MKPTHLCFIFLFIFTYSCEKDNNKIDDFLNQENIQVDLLLGEWNWEVTNGGWGTNSTPETVGYQRTISFTADRKYREYVDSELILETYYRIDSVVGHMNDKELYRITYYKEAEEQNFLFDLMDEKPGLYMYDLKCFDCTDTHVYTREN